MKGTKSLAVVILAAGKGKRMDSALPKVLHQIAGKPIIEHVIGNALKLKPERLLVVIGHKWQLLKKALDSFPVSFVLQKQPKGTGEALSKSKKILNNFVGTVLVLCGDVPFLSSKTMQNLIVYHLKNKAPATVLTAIFKNPGGYGRIIRNKKGQVQRIVEDTDATPQERRIKEINTGTFCFTSPEIFEILKKIKPKNIQKEYYLTDAVEKIIQKKEKVCAYVAKRSWETRGVNFHSQLKELERIFTNKQKT